MSNRHQKIEHWADCFLGAIFFKKNGVVECVEYSGEDDQAILEDMACRSKGLNGSLIFSCLGWGMDEEEAQEEFRKEFQKKVEEVGIDGQQISCPF
ncbi:MAG TPA: hypothetical protein VKO61_00505 [Candidatus Paceibacterota bacterium]|nr:hypothetical protein [Candidatus Paceibacterota bacterium]